MYKKKGVLMGSEEIQWHPPYVAAMNLELGEDRDKLFGYFKEHGVEVENPCKGIYYIREMVLFPTQIIVTKELDSEKHRWLCALSGQLAEQDLRGLLTSISCLEGKMEKEYADSVLEVALRANRGLAEKLRRDDNMSKTLMEIMEPVLAEVRQELSLIHI